MHTTLSLLDALNPIITHLHAFIEQFHPYGTNSNAYRGMKEQSYRVNFLALHEEARRMSLRDTECPMFADYSVTKAKLHSLSGVGEMWNEAELLPTYFRKSTIKGARNFVGPQPPRAFFRLCAVQRYDPERNRTALLKAREIAFFAAQYQKSLPFADGRSLRFPAWTKDGHMVRYAPPVLGDEPRPASLSFVDPNTPLAENESWLLVNHVICL